jgi:hypothetical protein
MGKEALAGRGFTPPSFTHKRRLRLEWLQDRIGQGRTNPTQRYQPGLALNRYGGKIQICMVQKDLNRNEWVIRASTFLNSFPI